VRQNTRFSAPVHADRHDSQNPGTSGPEIEQIPHLRRHIQATAWSQGPGCRPINLHRDSAIGKPDPSLAPFPPVFRGERRQQRDAGCLLLNDVFLITDNRQPPVRQFQFSSQFQCDNGVEQLPAGRHRNALPFPGAEAEPHRRSVGTSHGKCSAVNSFRQNDIHISRLSGTQITARNRNLQLRQFPQ